MILILSIFRFLLPQKVTAITIWPFIIFKENKYANNAQIINHENIHLRQQVELLVLPFYLIYLLEYLIGLASTLNHQKAYENISFEREAYRFDRNLNYLDQRKRWAMWRANTTQSDK